MIGGGGPLHAARVAEKLDIARVIVPAAAGVGSAVGFLRAPIAYEVVKTQYQRLGMFDFELINQTLVEMQATAAEIVSQATRAPGSLVRNASTTRVYGRSLGGLADVEVASWVVTVTTEPTPDPLAGATERTGKPQAIGMRDVLEPGSRNVIAHTIYERTGLFPGAAVPGPAIIVESETSTVVSPSFNARVNAFGDIEMTRKVRPS